MNLRTAICVFKFLRNRILECCNCDLLIIPFTFKRRANQLTAYLSSLPLSFLLRFFPFRDTFFLFNFHFWCQRTWDLKKAMESDWLLSSRKKILGSQKHGTVPRANNLQEPSKTYGINRLYENKALSEKSYTSTGWHLSFEEPCVTVYGSLRDRRSKSKRKGNWV